MVIPEWFVWLQGTLTMILVPICGAALNVLWKMRQELTTLNVKMEVAHGIQTEVDQLWSHYNQLKNDGGQLPYLAKTIDELKEEINKLRKRNHVLTNQLTVITAKLDISEDRNRQMMSDSESDSG